MSVKHDLGKIGVSRKTGPAGFATECRGPFSGGSIGVGLRPFRFWQVDDRDLER